MDRLVLIHSPLVGPETWLQVAEELRGCGIDVFTPSLAGVFEGEGPYYRAIGDTVARQVKPSGPTVVLVAHSGAGGVLPAATGALVHGGTAVRGAIFVDAILPHAGHSWFDTTSPERAQQVRDLAVEGRLPPWHEWFPPGALESLVPDASQRQAFEASVPRLPLAYFEEFAPPVNVWPVAHAAYIRLSDAYRGEAAQATTLGWPVVDAGLDHLAPLTRPSEVAELIEQAFAVMMTG